MSKKPRDNRPYLPLVKRIELPEGNVKLRWILIVVLLAIGSVAIGTGIQEAVSTQPGWNEVTAVSDRTSCASEFKLMYDFSKSGGNASAVNKELTGLYSQACEDAFLIFSPDVAGEGNLHSLNGSVNQTVSVDPVLYQALALLTEYENRCIFLAPVYVEYDRVFLSGSDGEAALYDPQKDAQAGAYVRMLMEFISDPNHISVTLSGGNQATLKISEEYRRFAEEYSIETFVDFGWLKNAFIADYLADTLVKEGYTDGYISSFDGFTRNLCPGREDFALNLFDRQVDTIYLTAGLHYAGRQSIVFLRDFPMSGLDRWRFYVYEDGTISSVQLAPETGVPTASVSTWISLSEDVPCARMLMEMVPVFLSEEFSVDAVNSLKSVGMSSVWCENGTVYYNAASVMPTLLDTGVEAGYKISFAE